MKTTFEELLVDTPNSVLELLEGLKELREREDYHPESSAAEHVYIVTNRLLESGCEADLVMTGLFHDLFKAKCATINEKSGKVSSPGHDDEAAKFIRGKDEVKAYIESNGANAENVAWLCEQHMRVKAIGEFSNKKRWALMAHELFPKLCVFALADRMLFDWADCLAKWNGSAEEKDSLIIGDVTYGFLRAQEVKMKNYVPVEKVEHRISGKELIAMGYPQGRIIGMVMKVADEKMADTPIEQLMEVFAYVLRSPVSYVKDEVFGEVAEQLMCKFQIL